ncbi:MAG: hypothetical protein R2702_03665 [Acidimicrobiales bacterium]
MSARRRAAPGAGVAGVVAGAAAGAIALALAPTPDEVHTLALADEPTLGALADAHRAIGDTLPVPWYALAWLARHVVGGGPLAARALPVLAWAAAAALLALALAPLGRRAAVVGTLVPTACELVFLGAFARPYAVVAALVAAAVLAWAVGVERPERRGPPATATIALGLAVLLHPTAAAVLVAFAAAELVVARPAGGRRRWLLALAVAAGPLALVVADLGATADRQRAIPSDLGPLAPLTSLASLGLPFAVLLVAAALSAGVELHRRGTTAIAPLERLGWLLLVLVPPVAVAGMWATSGVWLHRYAAPAVLGAALVVGHRARPVVRAAPGLAVAVVVLAALALHARATVVGDHLTRAGLDEVVAELGLDDPGPDPVPIVVADPYVFELLSRTGALPGDPPLRFVGDRAYASSPAATWDERRAELDGRAFVLVGSPDASRGLLGTEDGERAVELGRAELRTSSGGRPLVAVRVEPAPG